MAEIKFSKDIEDRPLQVIVIRFHTIEQYFS